MKIDNKIILSNINGDYYVSILDKKFKCCIGENGVTSNKLEGDGKTPIGNYPLREIWVREDKLSEDEILKLKKNGLPIKKINFYDGWCDESSNLDYNKHVDLRTFDTKVSHEKLCMEDNLYDCLVVLGYNDCPIIPGKGSAIFMHIARESYSPTAGCVALSKNDLLDILYSISSDCELIVKE
jgi:L,D-peptidoglycan transpeptidase YkuD (ErfK/YbiS/YcfS/YnhG family)